MLTVYPDDSDALASVPAPGVVNRIQTGARACAAEQAPAQAAGRYAAAMKTGRIGLRLLLAVPVATVALAASAHAVEASAPVRVGIVDRAYQPTALTVGLGQTVTWTNESFGPHTVTSVDGLFDSGKLNPTNTFSVTFSKAGTYDYKCTIHPTMQGSVLVLALAPGAVVVKLSLRHGAHGPLTVAHVQVARSLAAVLLQARPVTGGAWRTAARGRLSAAGVATLGLAGDRAQRLRVVVMPADGAPRLVSRVLRAPS
jgi:plastocyanin